MKESKLLFICMFICLGVTVTAQNCHQLVSPHFPANVYNNLPSDKVEYYCRYARAAFYKTNVLPDSAIVYQISDVVNKQTNAALPQTVQINLNTFSVFAYNFDSYQYQHWDKEVYFETSDTTNRYLVLRSIRTIHRIVDDSYRYNTDIDDIIKNMQ